jgi:hypothetical protein
VCVRVGRGGLRGGGGREASRTCRPAMG